MTPVLKTERLLLRPWDISDAADLYRYAKDDRVGPPAGWPPHGSIAESEEIIRTIFMQEGVYALALDDGRAIGCVGVVRGERSNLPISEMEGEISYWIGVPFWGKGLVTEAVCELIRHAFKDLGLDALWCGYFDGNIRSERVQRKCGFIHHHTNPMQYIPMTGDSRIEHISRLTRSRWEAMASSPGL